MYFVSILGKKIKAGYVPTVNYHNLFPESISAKAALAVRP